MVEKQVARIDVVLTDEGYFGVIEGDSSLVLRFVADQMIRIVSENFSKNDVDSFLLVLKKDLQAAYRRLEKGGDD